MMPKPTILITGAQGQVGKEFQVVSAYYPQYDFVYLSKADLRINDNQKIIETFEKIKPAFCINCAAYTEVDKAESDIQNAFLINAEAVGLLAVACKSFNAKFIHVSTDYVFDGNSSSPLKENDPTNPINVYGASKLKGEELAISKNSETIIIRTSWVYSEFGNNFVKTMMRLMKEKESINVVNDQIGSPTYAYDLAIAILSIIDGKKFVPGVYNFSNIGEISWYDFAVAIKAMISSNCSINPVPASQYPAPAKRPHYSLLDKTKIIATYPVILSSWKESLSRCIDKIKSQGT